MLKGLALGMSLVIALFLATAGAQLTMTGVGGGFGSGAGTPSVTFDAFSSGGPSQSSPGIVIVNASLMTVSGGLTNPGLVGILAQCDGALLITSPTWVWDQGTSNQSMTLIGSANSLVSGVFLFGLRNPVSGTKNYRVTWTNTAQVTTALISFSNVNQTSDAAAFKNFNSATNTAPSTVNVTSASGHQVVAGYTSLSNFTSVNNNPIGPTGFNNSCNTYATAANYANGSGTVTMTGNPGNAVTSVAAGMDISN